MKVEKKNIFLCVTNDLTADKRMHQTADDLASSGARVTLIGRQRKYSQTLEERNFLMNRLQCFFESGPMFYLEYNLRLFFYLRRQPQVDIVTACDPDTLPALLLLRRVQKFMLVYDSHEYFTEVPELRGHKFKQWIWSKVEQWGINCSQERYTVNPGIAQLLEKRYGRPFEVVYNYPRPIDFTTKEEAPHRPLRLFYQGVLNEGRGLEILVESMEEIPEAVLSIFGEGILKERLEKIIEEKGLQETVFLKGLLAPDQLYEEMLTMDISFNLLDARSLNYYYSTANKFYDAVRCKTPQITMDFPEYKRHIEQYKVGILLTELTQSAVSQAVQKLRNPQTYTQFQSQCEKASKEWIWPRNTPILQKIYGME